MKIELKKFGTTLISREAGREALAAMRPNLRTVTAAEDIEVDFSDVLTFSPSWGEEFLIPLCKEFAGRFVLGSSDNLSVRATLEMLEEINNIKFKIK